MTRGKIVLVTNKKIRLTGEYNGDMYIKNGWGEKILKALPSIKTKQDYFNYVESFTNEYYDDSVPREYLPSMKELKRENRKYNLEDKDYKEWGYTDYFYIKNISDTDIDFMTKNGLISLHPNGILVLDFFKLTDECKKYSIKFDLYE